MLHTGDESKNIEGTARAVLGRGAGASANEKPDELGHRVRAGGMSEEELDAFLRANPERAVEMAKIATTFQGAAEKVPAARRPRTATISPAELVLSTKKRGRFNPGDVVNADADIPDEDPVEPALKQRRAGGRKSQADTAMTLPAKSAARIVGRRVDNDNPFAEAFPMHRTPINQGYPFGTSLLLAAVLMDGPVQREDKEHTLRHLLVVKSAIANSFDSKGIVEFEAIELDPDVSDKETNELISSFCLARVESTRVILLATLARLKAWMNMNLFGPAGPHRRTQGL